MPVLEIVPKLLIGLESFKIIQESSLLDRESEDIAENSMCCWGVREVMKSGCMVRVSRELTLFLRLPSFTEC